MKYDLYTYVYNDEDMLPFFLKYYSFVDRMTFIESGSTDSTREILESFAQQPESPTIRVIETGITWWDHNRLHEYKNTVWKDSKMDYILFPDVDEIFYHPAGLKRFIEDVRSDIFEMDGYEMVSDSFPQDLLSVNMGVYSHMYNKSTIFKPGIDITFLNAHVRCSSSQNVCLGGIKLLHYRNCGIEQMKKRRDREAARLPKNCKYRSFPANAEIQKRHKYLKDNAIKVI